MNGHGQSDRSVVLGPASGWVSFALRGTAAQAVNRPCHRRRKLDLSRPGDR